MWRAWPTLKTWSTTTTLTRIRAARTGAGAPPSSAYLVCFIRAFCSLPMGFLISKTIARAHFLCSLTPWIAMLSSPGRLPGVPVSIPALAASSRYQRTQPSGRWVRVYCPCVGVAQAWAGRGRAPPRTCRRSGWRATAARTMTLILTWRTPTAPALAAQPAPATMPVRTSDMNEYHRTTPCP